MSNELPVKQGWLPLPGQEGASNFRLRTGHSRLNARMYKLKLATSPKCSCGSATKHLQRCPLLEHKEERCGQWRPGYKRNYTAQWRNCRIRQPSSMWPAWDCSGEREEESHYSSLHRIKERFCLRNRKSIETRGYLICTRGRSPRVLIRLLSVFDVLFLLYLIVKHKKRSLLTQYETPGKSNQWTSIWIWYFCRFPFLPSQ
jgi:hypothetical protein